MIVQFMVHHVKFLIIKNNGPYIIFLLCTFNLLMEAENLRAMHICTTEKKRVYVKVEKVWTR